MTSYFIVHGIPILWILWTIIPIWYTVRSLRIARGMERTAESLPPEVPDRDLRIRIAETPATNCRLRMMALVTFDVIGIVAIVQIPVVLARICITVLLFFVVFILGKKSRQELVNYGKEEQIIDSLIRNGHLPHSYYPLDFTDQGNRRE